MREEGRVRHLLLCAIPFVEWGSHKPTYLEGPRLHHVRVPRLPRMLLSPLAPATYLIHSGTQPTLPLLCPTQAPWDRDRGLSTKVSQTFVAMCHWGVSCIRFNRGLRAWKRCCIVLPSMETRGSFTHRPSGDFFFFLLEDVSLCY